MGPSDRVQFPIEELDGPVPEIALMELEANAAPDMSDEDGVDVVEDEAAVKAMEMEKAMVEAGCALAGQEDCDIFILADTDDEIDEQESFGMSATGGSKIGKLKTFNFRPAYKKLEELNLVALPRHVTGCWLAYHSTSQQWHASYPGVSCGLTATWGSGSKRTEPEAIMKVVKAAVTAHVTAFPKDKLWVSQLQRIKDAEAKGTF